MQQEYWTCHWRSYYGLSNEEQNTFKTLNAGTGIIFFQLFRRQIKNVLAGCEFWDLQCKVHLVIEFQGDDLEL